MASCKKCGADRPADLTGPTAACPACGAIYAKVEAYLAKAEAGALQEEADRLAEARQRRFEEERQAQKKAAALIAEERRQERAAAAAAAKLSKQLICTDCGTVGESSRVTRGSFVIEVILWLCFLIPGLIYSVWRQGSKFTACGQCRGTSLVPVGSPRGKKLFEEHH